MILDIQKSCKYNRCLITPSSFSHVSILCYHNKCVKTSNKYFHITINWIPDFIWIVPIFPLMTSFYSNIHYRVLALHIVVSTFSSGLWQFLLFFTTLTVFRITGQISSYRMTLILDLSIICVIRLGLWVLKSYHRNKVPFSLHHIRKCIIFIHMALLVMLIITWLRLFLPDFSTVKLIIFSFCK